ncbi:MAG: hypothetical protein RL329_3767 [Bacteroidota bacterium]|jgi:hypothetical protein
MSVMLPYLPDDLRQYYNHTIHPELMRMERKRHQLLLLLAVSFLLILGIIFLQLYIGIFVITLILMIPVVLYITFLYYELEKFKHVFKPKIINLVLDFIDNDVSYSTLEYKENASIAPKVFFESKLFAARGVDYVGEDYITGKIGELEFELSELMVKKMSPVLNRLDNVFRGVFLHAKSHISITGQMIILPRHLKQYYLDALKDFNLKSNARPYEMIKNVRFRESFMVYCTPDANVKRFLSEDMQKLLLKYRDTTGKDMHVSFIDANIYIAVAQQKDILEPVLWQSNVSFDLIQEFHSDLIMLMKIVRDFDECN